MTKTRDIITLSTGIQTQKDDYSIGDKQWNIVNGLKPGGEERWSQ